VDGRVAKGIETRLLLVDTTLDLIADGDGAPTFAQVARRAGVSVRVVFNHFDGMEGLLHSALARQCARFRGILCTIPPHGDAELRIGVLCRQRRLYFEEVAPVFRAALSRTVGEDRIGEVLAEDRARLRSQLAHTLAPEIARRGPGAGDLLDALAHASGWDAWRSLRHGGRRSPPSAERLMAFTLGRPLD
jgi:TetR/AcrR family transcriptional regulator, regulator of autoinduction and epiphytic fitness